MDYNRGNLLIAAFGLLLAACFLVSGCGPTTTTTPSTMLPWSQIHGDMRNTSFQLVGPRTLDISKAQQFVVGDPVTSTPVETPSGTILLAVQVVPSQPTAANNQNPNPTWTVLQIHPAQTSGLPVTAFFSRVSGQIATPVVDSKGFVYVANYTYSVPGRGNSAYLTISKIGPDGTVLWSRSDPATFPRPHQAPAPKLVESGGQEALFVGVVGNPDYRVLAIDDKGNFDSVTSCKPSESSSGFFASAAPPAPPPPPYFEDPTISLATDANGTPYLIDPATNCGIGFFLLDSVTTIPADWPTGLFFPKLIKLDRTDAQLGTPAISTFAGYAIIPQDQTLQAYNFVTAKKIKDWSTGVYVASVAPVSIALNSFLSESQPLYLFATDHPTIRNAPSHVDNGTYVAAITPNMIYALETDGVYAFDTNLNLKSFAAIPPGPSGSGGGLAVTSNGSLVVASRNGTTYIFPPN